MLMTWWFFERCWCCCPWKHSLMNLMTFTVSFKSGILRMELWYEWLKTFKPNLASNLTRDPGVSGPCQIFPALLEKTWEWKHANGNDIQSFCNFIVRSLKEKGNRLDDRKRAISSNSKILTIITQEAEIKQWLVYSCDIIRVYNGLDCRCTSDACVTTWLAKC